MLIYRRRKGKSLAVLHLPFDGEETTRKIVRSWRENKVHTEHWDRDQFQSWAELMVKQGQIEKKEQYQGSEAPPDSLNLQYIPFLQGLLYVGSHDPLGESQIELVDSLADAFSVAYARYEDFRELEKAKHDVEATLAALKATQAQLIQSEKMASLGELTAGIAHEIKNPLNFINNFSEINVDLSDELIEAVKSENIEEVMSIAVNIKMNEEKINHHGKRADAIVKGMLQHSRTSSGYKEATNINALVDEYARLSLHGLKTKDRNLTVTLTTNYDPDAGTCTIIPQDIGRVLLNLFNNALYEVCEKKAEILRQQSAVPYEPTVTVTTKRYDNHIEITVKDNGSGIPDKFRDKIFQPFFTTKPAGDGTGLGLSLSYDIVTKGHGGQLDVQSREGEFTEFIIRLPFQ